MTWMERQTRVHREWGFAISDLVDQRKEYLKEKLEQKAAQLAVAKKEEQKLAKEKAD